MADTEEPRFNSLAERIAALNRHQSFESVAGGAAGPDRPSKKAPPPLPGRSARTQTAPVVSSHGSTTHQTPPRLPQRTMGTNLNAPPPLPRRDTQISAADTSNQVQGRPGPPPLPSRAATTQSSPALPPRNASAQPTNALSGRRNSASSEVSTRSSVSSLSLAKTPSSTTSQGSNGFGQRKLPPAYDPASLPRVPPTRREPEAKFKEAARQSRSVQEIRPTVATVPNFPPRLPVRSTQPQNQSTAEAISTAQAQQINVSLASSTKTANHGAAPRPPPRPKLNDAEPPPVPIASRPPAAQIQAISTRPNPEPPTRTVCWTCRDWSGPDAVAAQVPRESVPRKDPVGYLAGRLCDPFPSYTDKARAIFTWFHHNISYDTQAFFSGNIGDQGPERTIFGGWAVCAGYAETYKAIAVRAGLECVVVTGHGKGFGHVALKKGETPPPPKPDGHAWNAVRVDSGEWKLIDACWGAGHICGANNLYKKEFHPTQFISPNDVFGRRHFPADPRYQFRDDDRIISWDEYYIGPTQGEAVEFYTAAGEEGISEQSIQPSERQIAVHGGQIVRFQFSKICEHWTSEKNGLGASPLFLLSIQGVDGEKASLIPMETDGYWHWVDVHARDLGAPGQSVLVTQLTSFDSKEGRKVRSVSRQEFLSKRGRVGMSWMGLMRWDLV